MAERPASVVVVDDSTVDREVTLEFLRRHGMRVTGASHGAEGLSAVRRVRPDLVIIDVMMEAMTGLEMLDSIRSDPALTETPVVLRTVEDSGRMAAEALRRGADDFCRKPSLVELLARIEVVLGQRAHAEALTARQEALERAAGADVLTGLPNRRLLEDELARQVAIAQRREGGLAVALVDVDLLKAVNDERGQPAGDQVLRELAGCLRARLREEDMIGRWGGDEFLAVVSDTSREGAAKVAEGLRAAAEAGAIDGPKGPVTISVGWAEWQGEDSGRLLARADQALYEAKEAGRNSIRPSA